MPKKYKITGYCHILTVNGTNMTKLTEKLFEDFEKSYNQKVRQETKRFKKYAHELIIKSDKTSLDIFWIADESIDNTDDLLPPKEIAKEIKDNLKSAMDYVDKLIESLGKK